MLSEWVQAWEGGVRRRNADEQKVAWQGGRLGGPLQRRQRQPPPISTDKAVGRTSAAAVPGADASAPHVRRPRNVRTASWVVGGVTPGSRPTSRRVRLRP